MIITRDSYVPTLALRRGEMWAMEYLPQATKARMVPCFLLAPWPNANALAKAVERIEAAYPQGPYILDLDRDYAPTNLNAPAQIEFMDLLDPASAFANWYNFLEEYPRAQPCLQLQNQTRDDIGKQVERCQKMDRRFCLRIFRDREAGNLSDVIDVLSSRGTADYVVLLEGGWARDVLQLPLWFSGTMDELLLPIDADIPVIVSCTSIPKGYSNVVEPTQIAFGNRKLIQKLQMNTNRRAVVYGDWGSTRPRDGQRGGPAPPRIDYPLDDSWWVFRNPDDFTTFHKAAKALENHSCWDGSTGQWGEFEILQAAKSPALGVNTVQKNITARVNLHLHRQAFYGAPPPPLEAFEDDYED